MAFSRPGLVYLAALLSTAGLAGAEDAWTLRNSGTTKNLNDVVWTGNQLVAVGDSGKILTSANGADWALRGSGTSYSLNSVLWTGSNIIGTGFYISNQTVQYHVLYVYYAITTGSSDGNLWSPASSKWHPVYSFTACRGLFFSTGINMATTNNLTPSVAAIRTSQDGLQWVDRYVSDTS